MVFLMIFALIVLIPDLFGRTFTTITDVSTTVIDGTTATTYTTESVTYNFFDASQGYWYNLQSAAYLTFGLVTTYGTILGVYTYYRMQRDSPEEAPLLQPVPYAGGGQRLEEGIPRPDREPPRATFQSFQGEGHTLTDSPRGQRSMTAEKPSCDDSQVAA